MTIELTDLLNKVRTYYYGDLDIIVKAYDYADYMHKGQFRQSGEPYIIHPLNVAYILAELHADMDTICAGLLHDTLEDTKATKDEIASIFNEDVANLVDGVTKISRMNFNSKQEQNLANKRKIITSISDDVRIIIIKLADRLHNMRTLQYKSREKQIENSIETMKLFVPFAYKIGAHSIQTELEDISFRYQLPDEYKRIKETMNQKRMRYEKVLKDMYITIDEVLSNNAIPHEIKIRIKDYYSIYQKQQKKKIDIDDIHDLLAIKVLVDDIKNCYVALGYIHSKYNPLNFKFKDYICNPKTNLYRSLHTTVFGPNETIVQNQIRTFDMDKINSFGITAYWDIKKGNARREFQDILRQQSKFVPVLTFYDNLFSDNTKFIESVENEILEDKVYVYDEKGNIVELPNGSTIVDYAYQLGEDIGNKLYKAKVNNKEVGLNYVLKKKDRVLIYNDVLSNGPKEEWIDYAKTTYAKQKIKENRR